MDEDILRTEWWLVTIGDRLHWARLDELANGHAHILAADGVVRQFVDITGAHTELMDADYRAFDGLDDDDAETMGFDLDAIEPPRADEDDDAALLRLMVQKIPGNPFQ